MKTAILAALIASPVLAAQPLSIEVRTRVDDIDARDLAERISDDPESRAAMARVARARSIDAIR